MKKKILFINGHLNTGGVEKSLLDILIHVDYDKYDVELLLTEQLGDYAAQLPDEVHVNLRSIEGTYGSLWGVIKNSIRRKDWFSLKMRVIFLLMRFWGPQCIALAKKMLTNNKEYDCVIGFRRGFCSQIAAYAVNAKKRITWWHHGRLNVSTKEYLAETKVFDRIVAVSEGCRNMLIQAMPALSERTITVHNILDVDRVRKMAEAFDPHFEEGLLHIVSVGGFVREKHFENAIYAAMHVKKTGLAFRWHLIGDGLLHDELLEKAKTLDVTACFIFEGNQVNPYPYIKNADLFVHPSYVESFGIVVTEALALGVPCVVTKSMGVMDFLIDGENAVLTERDPIDLTEKVKALLVDEQLRARLKEKSHCPKCFQPATVMGDFVSLLES